MTNQQCQLFAYKVTGRRTWQPWLEESTTVLAADCYQASLVAGDHHNLKGCRITKIERR